MGPSVRCARPPLAETGALRTREGKKEPEGHRRGERGDRSPFCSRAAPVTGVPRPGRQSTNVDPWCLETVPPSQGPPQT